jgi:hypothetical protein
MDLTDAAVEPASADLAAVAAEISEEFPLVLDQTSLVLLDLDPGHLHAFWVLASADLHRAGAAFRDVGAPPELVIRLRRLHPDGGAEILSRVVQPTGPKGDARFDLDNDDATYEAELGLSADDGGWLLLARSNQARLPRAVGTPIPPWTDKAAAVPPVTGPASATIGASDKAPASAQVLALAPGSDRDATQGPIPTDAPAPAPEPAAIGGLAQPLGLTPGEVSSDAQTGSRVTQLRVPPLRDAQRPDPGTRPARWVLAAARGGFAAADAGIAAVWPAALDRGTTAELAAQGGVPAPDRAWQPAIRIDWPWTEPVPPMAESAPEVALAPRPAPGIAPGTTSPATRAPEPSAAAQPDQAAYPEPPGPVSSFVLGRGPEAPMIEAEVLVHITARPGTLVDLHGRPVRVGPSGRSTLRLPVTDLALLTALLGLPGGDA